MLKLILFTDYLMNNELIDGCALDCMISSLKNLRGGGVMMAPCQCFW